MRENEQYVLNVSEECVGKTHEKQKQIIGS